MELGNRTMPQTIPNTPTEIIEVETIVVACDGGDGPLGHPRVYLNIGKDRRIDCPYCSRRYVLKAGVAAAGH
jgi:uncharacterized Zn-finger protein